MVQQTVNRLGLLTASVLDLTEALSLCEATPAVVLHVFYIVVCAHGIHAVCECGIRLLVPVEE